ncbi:hypothetical protein D3C84_1155590 [compost metagenome]
MGFQVGNCARDVGRRGVQLRGGGGETASFGNTTERAHVLQGVHGGLSWEVANCDTKLQSSGTRLMDYRVNGNKDSQKGRLIAGEGDA